MSANLPHTLEEISTNFPVLINYKGVQYLTWGLIFLRWAYFWNNFKSISGGIESASPLSLGSCSFGMGYFSLVTNLQMRSAQPRMFRWRLFILNCRYHGDLTAPIRSGRLAVNIVSNNCPALLNRPRIWKSMMMNINHEIIPIVMNSLMNIRIT